MELIQLPLMKKKMKIYELYVVPKIYFMPTN